jgi:hypothetical protein
MQQSPPLEADSSLPNQEISCILWNLQVHNRIHKRPSAVPVLSQTSPVHAFSSGLFKIQFYYYPLI